MAQPPIIYDLVLLLSTSAPEEDRGRVRTEVQSAITGGGGRIERDQEWGGRQMSYPIDHQGEAEYHVLQFAAPTSVLETLSHHLRIAPEVLRFRIIKVRPGTPPAPDSPPPLVGVASSSPAGAPGAADDEDEGL